VLFELVFTKITCIVLLAFVCHVYYVQTMFALFKFDDWVPLFSFACNNIILFFNEMLSVARQTERLEQLER